MENTHKSIISKDDFHVVQ
ncbi:hypothetical protein [Bacillus atrophaeus]|nr:hypothetical protein [Bacillus atrophaeus]